MNNLKRALSLANKDGREFIKRWVLGFGAHKDCKVIGIENVDYASSWFLLVYEYVDMGVRCVRFASISKTKVSMKETKVSEKIELTPMMRQYRDLKHKHPDAVLLLRCGDFYETYCDDATVCATELGITLTRSSKTKEQDGRGLRMAGFPYHALDCYLPKLIRAGHRVVICDQIER